MHRGEQQRCWLYLSNRVYNLGQNKWNIWTTPPPISMMPKWRNFCSFCRHHCFGGGRGLIVPFYSVQDSILDKVNGTSGPPLPHFNDSFRYTIYCIRLQIKHVCLPKWCIFCSFPPSSLVWGKGANCFFLFCPRL